MDVLICLVSFASLALGFKLGLQQEKQNSAKQIEHIRLAIAKQYHDRWEAMYGPPTPTQRNDQGVPKVIDLRMRKK